MADTKQRKTHSAIGTVDRYWPSKYDNSPDMLKIIPTGDGDFSKPKTFFVWPDQDARDILKVADESGAEVSFVYYNKKNKKDEWESVITEAEVVGGGGATSSSASEPAAPSTQGHALARVLDGILEDGINHLTTLREQVAKL